MYMAIMALWFQVILDYGEYPAVVYSVVEIAIPNAHTLDDATDSLSLRSFYGKNYLLL